MYLKFCASNVPDDMCAQDTVRHVCQINRMTCAPNVPPYDVRMKKRLRNKGIFKNNSLIYLFID